MDQKENKKAIQPAGLHISKSICQVTVISDLLYTKHITEQIATYGQDQVKILITASVNKCIDSLDISMNDDQLLTLVEDIIDVYKYESIEDIQLCLKNGRQGRYGVTYGKLNMIVFREWMANHLESKAIAREAEMAKAKNLHEWETKEDYNNSVRIGLENQEKIAKLRKEFELKRNRILGKDRHFEEEVLKIKQQRNDTKDEIL